MVSHGVSHDIPWDSAKALPSSSSMKPLFENWRVELSVVTRLTPRRLGLLGAEAEKRISQVHLGTSRLVGTNLGTSRQFCHQNSFCTKSPHQICRDFHVLWKGCSNVSKRPDLHRFAAFFIFSPGDEFQSIQKHKWRIPTVTAVNLGQPHRIASAKAHQLPTSQVAYGSWQPGNDSQVRFHRF